MQNNAFGRNAPHTIRTSEERWGLVNSSVSHMSSRRPRSAKRTGYCPQSLDLQFVRQRLRRSRSRSGSTATVNLRFGCSPQAYEARSAVVVSSPRPVVNESLRVLCLNIVCNRHDPGLRASFASCFMMPLQMISLTLAAVRPLR